MKIRIWMMGFMTVLGSLAGCLAQDKGFQSVQPDEFEALLTDTTVFLLDVRTPDEFAAGHLKGAQNIDVQNEQFEQNILRLPKERTLAVYCRSGRRSKRAAEILVSRGYRVIELDNGYLGWTGSGKPVTNE